MNFILPPRCPISGDIVDRVGAISPSAWKDITFITHPSCRCCGIPFIIDHDISDSVPDYICADCITYPKHFDRAKSALVYDNASKSMILAFKHGDALHLHTTLVPLLLKCADDMVYPDSIIIPVPLHWSRLVKRRYNQAAILAQHLSKQTGTAYWPDALVRLRRTPPQGHMNAKDRFKNVAGAFEIHKNYMDKIIGKKFVLIDDVFTTGATLDECSKVLKAGGAESIHILTVARAVKQ